MKRFIASIILVCIFLPACAVAPAATPLEQLTIQYSAAVIPWLPTLFRCSDGNAIDAEQRGTDFLDIKSADMVIRLGKPDILSAYVYQLGTDELLVITNSKNPARQLTPEQVYKLFTGQIQDWSSLNGNTTAVQVWIFANGEDITELFKQYSLRGSPVSSAAHLANNPQEMVQAIEKDINAIGIITRRLLSNENVTVANTVASNLPMLGISSTKPNRSLAHLITCMQK